MTAKEIIKKIQELGISVEDFAYGDLFFLKYVDYLDHPDWEEYKKLIKIKWILRTDKEKNRLMYLMKVLEPIASKKVGIGEWKEVEQKGGEGQGDEWYSVKYFKDHNVYIRTDGYYQSHYGTDFDYGYGEEVFPKEVKIIIYS